MFRGSLIALLVAALAAGFLGGRLTTSGQGTELEALQQAVAQLSQRIEKLETGMAAAGELQALTGRVASLEEGLYEQQAATSGQETKVETLKGTIAQLSQTVEELKTGMVAPEELQGLSDRVATLEEDLQEQQAAAGEQGTEIATLRGTIAQLSQKLEELERGIVAPEDFQGLSDRVATLEEDLRQEQATTGEQGADIEALNQTLARLSQKVEQLEIGIARAATVKELQGLADQIATLEEQLQGQWEGRFDELRVKLGELAAEVEAGAERKLNIGYVDIATVYQRLRQSGVEPGELESRIQGVIRQIGEEGGYDLIIQENSVILYPQAKSIADLTDQVIEALEQQ